MVVPRKGRLGFAELPCRLVDPDLFFAEAPTDVEAAKALCLDCPVREACLAGALKRREPWGVWGGELIENGRIVVNKRPRGRPPKNPRPAVVIDEVPIPPHLVA